MKKTAYERALLSRYRKLVKAGIIAPVKVRIVNARGVVEYDPAEHPPALYRALESGDTVRGYCRGEGISRSLFYQWVKRYPEFARALEEGREAGKAIWRARCLGEVREINPKTGKLFPNYSYHRLLAVNIYGRGFLPEKRGRVSWEEYRERIYKGRLETDPDFWQKEVARAGENLKGVVAMIPEK